MYGWRAKLGLILPANNTVIEPELTPYLPRGVSLHASRMRIEGPFEAEALQRMEQNALRCIDELAQSKVDVAVYCCLSTSLAKGWEWDRSVPERYAGESCTRVFSAATAVVSAMQRLGVERPVIVSPYPSTIHPLIEPFFASYGFEVVASHNMEIAEYDEVIRVSPEDVYRLARAAPTSAADGITILATDLQTIDVVDLLETDTGLPVVSTNQAILWKALRIAGVADHVPGLGRLLTLSNQ